jgi:hypothetical protein
MTFIDQTCPYINPHYLYRSVPFHHAPDPWLYASGFTPHGGHLATTPAVGQGARWVRRTWEVHLVG